MDNNSWKTLYEAAKIRHFKPILLLCEDNSDVFPGVSVLYHRSCRSDFTHKKSLEKFKHDVETFDNMSDSEPRRSSRDIPSCSTTRLYEKNCIFCQKVSKYIKGTHTREALICAVDLRADKTIRDVANARFDSRILAITARDIVAAEAHYHASCYKAYTRPEKSDSKAVISKEDMHYQVCEISALESVYQSIRNDLFLNPRILCLTNITSKFITSMNSLGIHTVSQSSIKHFRRNLEMEFRDTLQFFTVNRRVYFMPDNLTKEALAIECIGLQTQLDTVQNNESDKICRQAATYMRNQIQATEFEYIWPPQPVQLTADYVHVPETLQTFLRVLLSGKEDSSSRVSRLVWSISQDIVTAVTIGKVKTSKHVLLPWVIKTLTGNVEVIKILNRLGHGCSYTALEEIDTALAIDKLAATESPSEVPLPGNIHQGICTVLAFDNIDRLEETLSGSGTSHRVNGIIVQPTSLSCARPQQTTVERKDKTRTIQFSETSLPNFNVGKRQGPPIIEPLDITTTSEAVIKRSRNDNHLWVLTRLLNADKQTVSSWTGYNILIKIDSNTEKDEIGYLPTINAPATEMSTVKAIMDTALEIISSLQLDSTAVFLDQALFAKATEIAWKYPHVYNKILLMMGNFHTICNFMSSIGKMFGGAGLRDIAVEAEVIAEGSIAKVLEGKQYNRGIRLHKLMYEALMRIAWKGFENWMQSNNQEENLKLDKITAMLKDIDANTCHDAVEAVLKDDSWSDILNLFDLYLHELRHNSGPLAKYWMMYIGMVETLLGLVRADREGNWDLHIACIRNVIPWCFALGKVNYARYLPFYYAQITQLKETFPDLYQHFHKGYFSVQQRSGNHFSRVAVDQTIEQTINKDTQTSGGTKGFSLRPGTLSKYYLNADHRAVAVRQLREIISQADKSSCKHPDLQGTRIQKDEQNVAAIVNLLENDWTNPFAEMSDLISLSTGVFASQEVTDDLLGAYEKGEAAYQTFQTNCLQKGVGFYDRKQKINLRMFGENKKKAVLSSSKEVILTADRRLFGTMILIAGKRNLDMKAVFSHPLGPLPWSLANTDGTLKKTNKAALTQHLESLVEPSDDTSEPYATVIDAMCLIQKLHGDNHTFDELSCFVLGAALHAGGKSARIDVVFDVYRNESIKSAERIKRGSQEGVRFHNIKPEHKIKNWRRMLACSESKTKLAHFLADSWKCELKRKRIGDKILFVTCDEKCFKITYSQVEEIEELKSNHEEADTRIFLHAKHAAATFGTVVIVADDTDVLIIALYLSQFISNNLLIRHGTKCRLRLLDIKKLSSALGKVVCSALLGLHSWTGCDSVSSFASQGKIKALKLLQNNSDYQQTFALLGSSWELTEELYNRIQKFACQLYCKNTTITTVNDLRHYMFIEKKACIESDKLPPCYDTLQQHTLRANYQAAIWRRSLDNCPHIPKPTDGHGWEVDVDGNLTIKWMTCLPAPDAVLTLLSCKCARTCHPARCSCILNGLKCTSACKLLTCANMEQEDNGDEENLCESDSEEDE